MKLRILALLLLLAACKEETAALPPAVPMTAQSVGYFCQMNVLEHGGPKGQVALDGLDGKPLFFSQVRDTVAYLRMPEQNYKVLATYVSDMGAAASWDQPGADNWVLIDNAVFVVGSDQMGGMDQPEFIPFADPAKAADFAKLHGGQVMALKDIPASALQAPETDAANSGDDTDYTARLRAQTKKAGG